MTIIYLQKKYYTIPVLDLELILSAALRKTKEFIYTYPEYSISNIQYLRFRWFIHLYKKGYSIAAIVGHKEFYGLDFYVNKHVLIPRPDTELMVVEVIEEIKNQNEKITLVDVGTGTGCIQISILKNLPAAIVTTYAVDISRRALKVAKKNARIHNVHIEFLRGNLLKPVVQKNINHKSQIIITANLPYLTEKQFQGEPSIQREPKNALVADNNGLALYEELLQQIKTAGLNATIFLEIDPSQSEVIIKIIKQYFPGANVKIKKDLNGLNRLVKIF